MIERFAKLPRSLAAQARTVRLASEIPALLVHPDWETPAPCAIWLHGRTAHKELDAGRYLRWMRAGIAACAIDLPGHGERFDEAAQKPDRTLDTLDQLVREIDPIVRALTSPEFGGVFDASRLALGGMSAGGMGALRRLCDEHPFVCAAVEGTCGSLEDLYFPEQGAPGAPWAVKHDRERVAGLDPMRHLETWRPIPLLVLHSEADEMVPWAAQRRFVEAVRDRSRTLTGRDLVEVVTWPETGAPAEHLGFGRFANDAKNAQTDFLTRHLRAGES
ncbi:MAG: alpha/beta hydrolase family protein [Phycisphaerales bacterium JB059]